MNQAVRISLCSESKFNRFPESLLSSVARTKHSKYNNHSIRPGRPDEKEKFTPPPLPS